MNILIIKLGSIGDVVHTLPALAAIKRAVPAARVSWVVERRMAEVLRDNPMIDELIEIDMRAWRRVWRRTEGAATEDMREWSLAAQVGRLRGKRYDVAIDFQGLMKSALVARIARARRRVGFAKGELREPLSRVLMDETIEAPAQSHIIRCNLALAAGALGINVPDDAAEFQFPLGVLPEHEAEARRVISEASSSDEARGGFTILNPGAGWWTKQWSAERFGQLADLMWEREGLPSLVTFGRGEEELAARVVAASRAGAARAATISLRGFVALARRASIYIGGDTGPTHLAVAAGAPIVGLFGPTEWQRNGSPHAADIVVERTDINCREDCHRRECGRWVCMDIETERVYRAVRERLALSGQMQRRSMLTANNSANEMEVGAGA